MIRKLVPWALLGFVLWAPLSAAELKIAVLDIQRALVSSEEAKTLLEQLQNELQKDEDAVNALGDEIRALQEKREKDAEIMSPAEQRRVSKDIEDKQIDYQFQVNKLQKEFNDRRQELLQVMAPKVNAVLQDLIELEGYDIILRQEALHYVNSKHDITRRVTEKLNEKREESGS